VAGNLRLLGWLGLPRLAGRSAVAPAGPPLTLDGTAGMLTRTSVGTRSTLRRGGGQAGTLCGVLPLAMRK